MMYTCDTDVHEGKVLKRRKINPTGEHAYLQPDATVLFDEDKIRRAQLIYLHHCYKPDGPGARRVLQNNRGTASAEPQSPSGAHTG